MQLSPHCFALTGFAYTPPWSVNAGIIAGRETTLIVDSGPTSMAAATIHGYATAIRPTNRLLVINTERHLDHINGNGHFADLGIDVYGHRDILRSDADLRNDIHDYSASIPDPVRRERWEGFIPFAGTRIVNPNKRIERDFSLDLGDVQVQIILTPGHTPTNLCVSVPTEGVVFCGDSVASGYQPNLEGADTTAWLESLDRLSGLKTEMMVCGHGPVLRGPEVNREIARVRAVIHEAMASGKPPTG